MLTMIFVSIFLASAIFGLILIAVGIIVLVKTKIKLPGILLIAVGLTLSLCTSALFLYQITTVRLQG